MHMPSCKPLVASKEVDLLQECAQVHSLEQRCLYQITVTTVHEEGEGEHLLCKTDGLCQSMVPLVMYPKDKWRWRRICAKHAEVHACPLNHPRQHDSMPGNHPTVHREEAQATGLENGLYASPHACVIDASLATSKGFLMVVVESQ